MKLSHQISIALTAVSLFVAAGCAPQPASEPVTITVSAAASLTEAFTEISAQFEAANPQVKVSLNFAASQQLSRQIVEGASVDVFASANQKQMGFVLTEQELSEDASTVFAGNRLVVIVPQDNPGNIVSLADLARPGLKLVFAAVEVPAGQYSLEFLDLASQSGYFGADYKDNVLANVVSYENNVRSVLTKVSLGEADGGIVYSTDAASIAGEIGVLQIPADLNVNANYWILALPDAEHAQEGQAFVDFVLSAQGQQVLEKHGFIPIQ